MQGNGVALEMGSGKNKEVRGRSLSATELQKSTFLLETTGSTGGPFHKVYPCTHMDVKEKMAQIRKTGLGIFSYQAWIQQTLFCSNVYGKLMPGQLRHCSLKSLFYPILRFLVLRTKLRGYILKKKIITGLPKTAKTQFPFYPKPPKPRDS